MKRTSHRIASGRAILAAEVAGSGKPVVFLHAAVCDSRMWQAQLDAVGTTNKAIAYDRRGFGSTLAEKEDHSAVADLLAVIDALADGEPAILVGCSQGGRIALDAALLHPKRFHGLVLISPSIAGAADPVLPPDIQALATAQKKAEETGDLDQLNAIKAHLWLDGPRQPEGRVAGQARDLFLDMNGIALRSPPVGANVDVVQAFPRLGEIAMPTLIVCGDFDFPHIVERCREITKRMPDASLRALIGAAHLPSLEYPQDISRLVTEFVERCNRSK